MDKTLCFPVARRTEVSKFFVKSTQWEELTLRTRFHKEPPTVYEIAPSSSSSSSDIFVCFRCRETVPKSTKKGRWNAALEIEFATHKEWCLSAKYGTTTRKSREVLYVTDSGRLEELRQTLASSIPAPPWHEGRLDGRLIHDGRGRVAARSNSPDAGLPSVSSTVPTSGVAPDFGVSTSSSTSCGSAAEAGKANSTDVESHWAKNAGNTVIPRESPARMAESATVAPKGGAESSKPLESTKKAAGDSGVLTAFEPVFEHIAAGKRSEDLAAGGALGGLLAGERSTDTEKAEDSRVQMHLADALRHYVCAVGILDTLSTGEGLGDPANASGLEIACQQATFYRSKVNEIELRLRERKEGSSCSGRSDDDCDGSLSLSRCSDTEALRMRLKALRGERSSPATESDLRRRLEALRAGTELNGQLPRVGNREELESRLAKLYGLDPTKSTTEILDELSRRLDTLNRVGVHDGEERPLLSSMSAVAAEPASEAAPFFSGSEEAQVQQLLQYVEDLQALRRETEGMGAAAGGGGGGGDAATISSGVASVENAMISESLATGNTRSVDLENIIRAQAAEFGAAAAVARAAVDRDGTSAEVQTLLATAREEAAQAMRQDRIGDGIEDNRVDDNGTNDNNVSAGDIESAPPLQPPPHGVSDEEAAAIAEVLRQVQDGSLDTNFSSGDDDDDDKRHGNHGQPNEKAPLSSTTFGLPAPPSHDPTPALRAERRNRSNSMASIDLSSTSEEEESDSGDDGD